MRVESRGASLWHSHSFNEMLQPCSIIWTARPQPTHQEEPESGASVALGTCSNYTDTPYTPFFSGQSLEPNSGCVASGLCSKRGSSMKKGGFIPPWTWFLPSRQTGPYTRGSAIALCCSHTKSGIHEHNPASTSASSRSTRAPGALSSLPCTYWR